MTIFYDPRQSVDGLDSLSPSAGKPARFVELMQHYEFHNYNQRLLGKVTPVTQGDLTRVHSLCYVSDVFSGAILNGHENRDPRVPESCLWTVGSLLAASRYALEHRAIACSPTSGFHHAGFNWGGGFCTFNGLMVVSSMLLAENPALKIGILDLDFHHGDGTSNILARHPLIAKSIIHRTSGLHFHEGDDPDEFFLWLDESITEINDFGCDLVLYQAGADMHIKDPLGGLLDTAQMTQRDRTVFRKIKAGIAWNLSGGYQPNRSGEIFDDPVLDLHRNTLREANQADRARHLETIKETP